MRTTESARVFGAEAVLSSESSGWDDLFRRADRPRRVATASSALLCLALQIESFPWWLAMIAGSVWIGMHIQNGRHGVGYLGTQAAFVFIVTLIQGPAPPTSIMPGIDRFVGISGGMAILLIISLMLWPNETERKVEQAS